MKTYPRTTPITYPWHLDTDGTKARLDVPLGEIPVPDHGLAALGIVAVGILGSQHRNVCLNRLGQEAWRSLAYHLCSGSCCGQLWMWKRNCRTVLPGVSTLLRREGDLDHHPGYAASTLIHNF